LAARLGEGLDQFARLELLRIDDDGLAGLAELIDVVPLDVLVLNIKDPRLFPFAERAELHLADDGVEARIVQIRSELALVGAACCGDRLAENLDRKSVV